jgi:ankyrin repeat protein
MSEHALCGSKGITPLHVAVSYGHVDAVRLLLANGADPNKRTEEGCSPLVLVTILCNDDAVEEDVMSTIENLLIEYGADYDSIDDFTYLHRLYD